MTPELKQAVDDVDVTGWGVWKGHAIPVEVAQHIAAKVNERIVAARSDALEEAAEACEGKAQGFLSPEYATGQPLSSFSERFACGECATAIRALADKPAPPSDKEGA